jgi:hypothetical protein
MGFWDDYLISAGKEIQHDLPELLGPSAPAVEEALKALIDDDQRGAHDRASSIYALLISHPSTNGWFIAYRRFKNTERDTRERDPRPPRATRERGNTGDPGSIGTTIVSGGRRGRDPGPIRSQIIGQNKRDRVGRQ